jgi:hypothetical protein
VHEVTGSAPLPDGLIAAVPGMTFWSPHEGGMIGAPPASIWR